MCVEFGHCLVVDVLCAELAGRQKPNGGLVEWLACKLNVIEGDRGSVHVHIVFVHYTCVYISMYILV